jgi:hypothetical protein
MANLLESSATAATTAPDYYNTYLSNIASKGADAAQNAQYVGAQPLQEKAFTNVENIPSTYKPTLTSAGDTLTSAAGYTSPLDAGATYLSNAALSPAQRAQEYMSPYLQSVVNAIGDVGQRNIQQNLAPAATAAAVGSGQFGSQRGAQVLGQTLSNADRDILNQQYQALNSGYNTALQTAQQQNQLLGQLGSTAGQQAYQGQAGLTNVGQAQTTLAKEQQGLSLADINALATLGGQQQTIAQNKELFPLQNLQTSSGFLRGYNVPTSTKTTSKASPLSTLGGIVTGTAGFLTPKYDSQGRPISGSSNYDQLVNSLKYGYNRLVGTNIDGSPITRDNPASESIEGLAITRDSRSSTGLIDSNGDPVNYDGTPASGYNVFNETPTNPSNNSGYTGGNSSGNDDNNNSGGGYTGGVGDATNEGNSDDYVDNTSDNPT